MSVPWRELKDVEIAILWKRRIGEPDSESDWHRLVELFDQCQMADDAEDAICFHGVAALIAERKGEFNVALKHRKIEIGMIVQ